jgi:hypothetical protein
MQVQDKIGHFEGRFFRYIPRPDGRTQVAGRANAGGRTGERGWPPGRTRVAARANAEMAAAFAPPAAERRRGFTNMLILLKAVLQGP